MMLKAYIPSSLDASKDIFLSSILTEDEVLIIIG